MDSETPFWLGDGHFISFDFIVTNLFSYKSIWHIMPQQ